MSVPSEDQRPITVGDIKKFQKGWLQSSSPILFYLGLLMIGLGIFSLFIPNTDGQFTLPFTIIVFLFGIGSVVLSFSVKKQAKKIQV